MKTVHIVVEGQADQVLLGKLLDDLEQSVHIQFHVAEGRQSAHPLARTLQVRRGEPVALVLDADTNDTRMAEEEQSMYESYLNFTSKGVPFIVILMRPSIEEIFFEVPEILSNLTGKSLESKDILVGKAAPRMYLAELGVDWLRLVPSLNEQQLGVLRAVQPVAALRHFVHDITENLAGTHRQLDLAISA